MGADLLVIPVSVKKNTTKMSDKAIDDAVKRGLAKMSQEVVKLKKLVPRDWAGFYEQENGDDAPDELEQVIDDVLANIKEFGESLIWRETTYVTYPERRVYLAGGTSWGDDPNESFRVFCKFSALPKWLLDIGGFD